MIGYYENEIETKKVIDKDGYFHSGDIGYIDKDSFIEIDEENPTKSKVYFIYNYTKCIEKRLEDGICAENGRSDKGLCKAESSG